MRKLIYWPDDSAALKGICIKHSKQATQIFCSRWCGPVDPQCAKRSLNHEPSHACSGLSETIYTTLI